MQGTAADIIKRAMIDGRRWLQDIAHCRARLIMQVHDELVLEVADAAVDETVRATARTHDARRRNLPFHSRSM